MSDQDDQDRDVDAVDEEDEHAGPSGDDDSAIDKMRGTGAGVEDPNIVGPATPGIVEEHVREDEPPEV